MRKSGRAPDPQLWKLTLTAPGAALGTIEGRLADLAGEAVVSISDFERADGDDRRALDALFSDEPVQDEIQRALAGIGGIDNLAIAPLESRDWVAESQAALAPIRAGRFFVYGGHDKGELPAGAIGLHIEAAQAFGTGHHATTLGCLEALDEILKARRPQAVLDLGCGTSVLAIAAAKALKGRVTASDNDPVAVRVTAENARLNGARLTAVMAEGLDHPVLRKSAPYDLILANILAEPLKQLAPDIARALRTGGLVILSGILMRQADGVVAAYRTAGFCVQRRRTLKGWATLVMQKR
jgi:ribosomal protein L11 methyltransferase